MNLATLIIQIILTIPLTIVLNYIERKKLNRINQVLIPTVYIILISALIPSIKTNIFLIVVFEIFIRNFYVTSITNQTNKVSNSTFIIESIVSISISLFTYNYFISQVDTVIPNPEEIKPFLWFLIIVYFTYIYANLEKDKEKFKKKKLLNLKEEQIITQYAKLKNQYSQYIKTKNNIIATLVYSVMIYKEIVNPRVYRKTKEFIGRILRKETEYGIAQIKSTTPLTDETSIVYTIYEFDKALKNVNTKEMDQLNKALHNYKDEEKEEIINIYKIISEFNKK